MPLGTAPLRGIIPPLVTPLAGRDALDVAGLGRLVGHVLAGGAAGLFLLGTTGEGPSVPAALRRELVRRVVELAAGRVPVIVHVTDTRLSDTVEAARQAAEAGADAAAVSAPYYLPLEQGELEGYVRAVLDEQPLPLFLYNMPLTRTCYEPDTVLRLARLHRVIGIKDSSGDPQYLRGLRPQVDRAGRPDWSFFVGPERLLAEAVAGGAHGCVGAGANVHPGLFTSLYEAVVRGDHARVAELRRAVNVLGRLYCPGDGAAGLPTPAGVVRGVGNGNPKGGQCARRKGGHQLSKNSPAGGWVKHG